MMMFLYNSSILLFSFSLSKRGGGSAAVVVIKTIENRRERETRWLFFLFQSNSSFSLSCEVCVVYICSRGIWRNSRASPQPKTLMKNRKTAKQKSSHFMQSFHTITCVTLQNCPLTPHTLLFTFARAREDRERHTHALMSSGVITRAQKRRMGERDLWDMIVNNDDICFEHILPWLNQTDIKFLYDVNSETRALIKRSSRKKDLKMKFRVNEMSSISTMEFAWEDRTLWPDDWDETDFCFYVAITNKLELLKWAREEKKCAWDSRTINAAAVLDNMEMAKYCMANRCPVYERACSCAALCGHLEMLKYLHGEKAPWDGETAEQASLNGHLHILEYLVDRKYEKYDKTACGSAAAYGHLECLKYLHETAKAPWDSDAVREAHQNYHPECLRYLLDNDCPLPTGWRYEDGELYSSESES